MNSIMNAEKDKIIENYCIEGNINTKTVINYILKELNKNYINEWK